MHRLLAEALAADDHPAEAAEEYESPCELEPDQTDVRLALAEAYAGCEASRTRPRRVLEELLKHDPDHPEAQRLLEKLQP